jgi:hypothetical protein
MAPSIFSIKSLRRRSRASFRTEESTDASSDGSHNTSATPTSGSLTPPSMGHQSDPALNLQLKDVPTTPPVPQRPQLITASNSGSSGSNSNRYSVAGMTGLGSPVSGRGPSLPTSQYAPHIANISDGQWVSQKVLLITGTIGDPSQRLLDGIVTVSRLDDSFPAVQWPVTENDFKALVYLVPGTNKIRFDFSSPKLANSHSSNPIHASYLTVHMMPSMTAPPLQLAVLLAKDSPGTFDAMPPRIEREGNGLDTAIRKFRMAAYLWQGFTAEQLSRNKLGRRAFRFEEEWITGSSCHRDREHGTMRSEARVHVIRTQKTVAELRELGQGPSGGDALLAVAAEAATDYFQPLAGQKHYISMLLLDSQWDPATKSVSGHAAHGGKIGDDMHISIYGSQYLQSYPMTFEDVPHAFTDCTPTDTNFVGNDNGGAGSSWEAASLGIGAHLHETGRLFGLPQQESGIMGVNRDFLTFSRSFLTREAFSTRTKSKGVPVSQLDDGCRFHRLDCLRLRSHPCFRLPNDPPMHPDNSIAAFPVEGGSLVVRAPSGMSFVEILAEGEQTCHTFIEYGTEGTPAPKTLTLSDADLRSRLSEEKRRGRMRIRVQSMGGGLLDVPDFKHLTKESSVKISGGIAGSPVLGRTGFRSHKLGSSKSANSEGQDIIFTSAIKQERDLSRIIFYHDTAVRGIEFVFDNDSRQLLGQEGGREGGESFEMGESTRSGRIA